MKRLVLLFAITAFTFGCASGSKSSKDTKTAGKEAAKAADKAKATKETKPAAAATASAAGKITCSVKGDERFIEVRPDGSGCQVAYTKGGTENVVATAQNGTSHCEATMNKIKGNLESAGYTCN